MEIENIILLPEVSRAIARHEGYRDAELECHMSDLESAVFEFVGSPGVIECAVVRYCKRRVQRQLTSIHLGTKKSVKDIVATYKGRTTSLDPFNIAEEARICIQRAVEDRNMVVLLSRFGNKALFRLAAKHLKHSTANAFKSWLARVLMSDSGEELGKALRNCVPEIP